jgi:biotin carboxyl carrier protein
MNKMNLKITINGTAYAVEVEKTGESSPAPKSISVPSIPLVDITPSPQANNTQLTTTLSSGTTKISAPMPGKINKVSVKDGDSVQMMNEIAAPVSGVVKSVSANTGDSVKPGQILMILEA